MIKKELILSVLKDNINASNTQIAEFLKKNYLQFKNTEVETLRKAVSKTRVENQLPLPQKENKKIIVRDANLEINKEQYLKTESEIKKSKTNVKRLEDEKQFLLKELQSSTEKLNILLEIQNEVKFHEIKPKFNDSKSEATAFLIASDWHIEEKVEPNTVNYRNEYNLSIAKSSSNNFFVNGTRLVEICNKDISINTIVLCLLGDFITGYIHPEFIENNYLSPTQAILEGLDLLGSGIEYLLKHTSCEIIIPCKIGNHGRTTEKKKISTAYKNSYEWLMYHILSKEFKTNDRVKFIIEDGYLTYLNVYDKNIRLHHGDAIRFEGGVGGLFIPANKAIAQWDKERYSYLDVFGHHHTQILDTGSHKFVCNGSLVGYNAYALQIKAAYEQPRQSFFLIDKHRGKIMSTSIFIR